LSLDTGGPMPAEQQALGFDHADLKFKMMPDKKAIEGEATLTFTAKAPWTTWSWTSTASSRSAS
jgi:aminopeptidase N